ncbi:MAG: nuclear transport factor 2 family protein [Actinomycetota bacterium]
MEPIDVVQSYFDRVYGDLDVEAIRELCADPYRRHEAGGEVHLLDHDHQLDRVRGVIAATTMPDGRTFSFTPVLMNGDGEHVSVTFDMTAPADSPFVAAAPDGAVVGEEIQLCGIEVFRIADGVITDVWNSSLMPGHWG